MNKVVLVTGASSGLGEAICKKLASEGNIVYGTSRKGNNEIKYGFSLINLDVENNTSVIQCIDYVISKEGKIDVLINNAGIGIMGSVEDCSDDEIYKAFNINVFGLIRTSRAVLPYMRSQKSGLIINIASIAGHMGLPYRAYYSATKSSVHRITEALRIEVKPFGINACIIDPGDFNTNISNNRVVAQKINKGTVYSDETLRIESVINEDIHNSLNADMFGDLILNIINSQKIKAYYRIAKPLQKLSVKVRSLLGADLFENILKKHYKIK